MAKDKKKDLTEMTLAELHKEATDFAEKSNIAFEAKKFSEALDAESDLKKIVDQYAVTKKEEVFAALKKCENPMLEAIKQLTYKVIVVKESVPEGKKYKTKSIEDKDVNIDLIALDKYCGGNIGNNPDWLAAVKFLLACVSIRHGKDLNDDAAVKEIEKSEAFTNLSAELREQILGGKKAGQICADKYSTGALNVVITLMLGEEYAKADDNYSRYLVKCGVKKGREKLTLNTVNKKAFTAILAEIIHGIIFEIRPTLKYKFK